jgi:hypothetical protein
LNDAGEEVSVSDLDAAEKAAYEARYGKIDKDLWLALQNTASDAMVEVDIWLKTPEDSAEPAIEKPEVNGGADQQTFENLSVADRKAIKEQLATDETVAAFDTETWDSAEATFSNAEMDRVEALTTPFVEELRKQGYEATANASAPMINVTMPVKLIQEYANRADVDTIYMGAKMGNEMNIARKVIGANTVNSRGITGTNSRIAVVEFAGMVSSTNPYLSGITRDNLYNCAVNWHVTSIAGIIRSTHATYRGVAPGTDLWVGCGTTDAQLQTMTTRANTWGADTYSLGWYSGSNHYPGAMDKFYDIFMFTYVDLVIKAAGNRGALDGWITPPGLGYNTLTVGNFNDRNTVSTSDDVMSPTSSWMDPLSDHGDREKPEVVAPGTNILSTSTASPWVGFNYSGTSISAPMVVGMTALLYQRNANLKAWPEATKAIIMATAIQNKEGASRLSDKDGAGGVWAPEADLVSRNNTIFGRWGGNRYTCSSVTNWNLTTMDLYAGYKTRVVIVWDQNPNYAYYSSKPSADIDLQVYNPSNTLVASSHSWDNTYEIVEFTPSVTGIFTLQVDKYRCDLTPAWIAWAWSQP